MAQRALIAMALASRPKLLIADEPTSGLDVTIQAQFLDQMWQTVQQTGSAVLLVTQELGIIANYCDRVLVLHDGRDRRGRLGARSSSPTRNTPTAATCCAAARARLRLQRSRRAPPAARRW